MPFLHLPRRIGRTRPLNRVIRREDIHPTWEKDLFFGWIAQPNPGVAAISSANNLWSIDLTGSASNGAPADIKADPEIGPCMANDADGGNKGHHFEGIPNKNGVSAMSVLCLVRYQVQTTGELVFIKYDGQNAAYQFSVNNSGTIRSRIKTSVTNYTNDWSSGAVENKWHVLGSAWGNDSQNSYGDGKEDPAAQSTSGTLGVTNNDCYIMRNFAASAGIWGRFAWVFLYARKLTKEEFGYLNNNFWGFVKPDFNRVYSFPSAAAVSTPGVQIFITK